MTTVSKSRRLNWSNSTGLKGWKRCKNHLNIVWKSVKPAPIWLIFCALFAHRRRTLTHIDARFCSLLVLSNTQFYSFLGKNARCQQPISPTKRKFAHKNQSLHTRVKVLHKQKRVPTLHRNRRISFVFDVNQGHLWGHLQGHPPPKSLKKLHTFSNEKLSTNVDNYVENVDNSPQNRW